MATAWHAVNLSMRVLPQPIHECYVLVIGGGVIGMLADLLITLLGVVRLALTEPNPLRREALQARVGCETLDPRQQAPVENQYDYVLDAVGAK